MEELGDKGFVFLDASDRPFLCRIWGGKPWLFYWHPDRKFVSLREVSQSEILGFPRNLSEEQQDLYLKAIR